MDVYVPRDEEEEDVEEGGGGGGGETKPKQLKPVVIFVTGGVWIIGYRVWGALLAKSLLEFGVITICIDYRNFPQGVCGDMVEDVSDGIGIRGERGKKFRRRSEED